jgi:hypothetical protein
LEFLAATVDKNGPPDGFDDSSAESTADEVNAATVADRVAGEMPGKATFGVNGLIEEGVIDRAGLRAAMDEAKSDASELMMMSQITT